MITKYEDITNVTYGIIAHGVNCKKVMGAGVALAIRNKWPTVFVQYMDTDPVLGTADFVQVDDDLYVANCYTQKSYGNSNNKHASADAISTSLAEVFKVAVLTGMNVVSLPAIGSDRGGLDWETEVLPIISLLDALHPTVETYLYLWK